MFPMHPKHPWGARFWVCVILLALSFIGLVFTNLYEEGGWYYWKYAVPVYALIALWLSWYLRQNKQSLSLLTLGHEIFHWLGLMGAAFLVTQFYHMGVFSRLIGSLVDLLLIAQAFFLAGIYIERTFIFIGIVLAIFSWSVAFTITYIYIYIALPVVLIALAGIYFYLKYTHRKSSSTQ